MTPACRQKKKAGVNIQTWCTLIVWDGKSLSLSRSGKTSVSPGSKISAAVLLTPKSLETEEGKKKPKAMRTGRGRERYCWHHWSFLSGIIPQKAPVPSCTDNESYATQAIDLQEVPCRSGMSSLQTRIFVPSSLKVGASLRIVSLSSVYGMMIWPYKTHVLRMGRTRTGHLRRRCACRSSSSRRTWGRRPAHRRR